MFDVHIRINLHHDCYNARTFHIVYLWYASFYLYFMHERTRARTFAKCFWCVYHSSHFYRSIIYFHVVMTQPTIHILRDFNTFSSEIHRMARDIFVKVFRSNIPSFRICASMWKSLKLIVKWQSLWRRFHWT